MQSLEKDEDVCNILFYSNGSSHFVI